MPFASALPQFSLTELSFEVWETGKLKVCQREEIRAILLTDCISTQDYRLINRLLYAVRRGWLGLAD
ncbi:hypothetical protein [Microcoleus sp. FACHB-68]|uniref:hypothetical protein n=1 Tax=Microcoleus sp. FACHB-68 TaxID=2692826 RepID=UPI001683ADB7|nr:hypothetical protein [Microcoleus sp. FACHB-68]MBD1937415.1 hypothetical protein [Microcoleus sp. FACHB-68]